MVSTERFEGQSNFAIFLRTGLRFRHQAGADVETKFNPWHDPNDGRFTFTGQGTNFGGGGSSGSGGDRSGAGRRGGGRVGATTPTSPRRAQSTSWTGGGFKGGGGGNFEGGGASTGFWEYPEERKARLAREAQQRATRNAPPINAPPVVVATHPQQIAERDHTTLKSGYRYDYDSAARTRAVDANLVLKPALRSRKNQSRAGGEDRQPNDDGGHYIAVRFNGSHSKLNHFAQHANFNRGAYRALADKGQRRCGKAKTCMSGSCRSTKVSPSARIGLMSIGT